MRRKFIPTSLVLVFGTLTLTTGALAQDAPELQAEREHLRDLERALDERNRQLELANEQRARNVRQAQLQQEEQQFELQRVQREMERAREDLERAARQVSRQYVQQVQDLERVQDRTRFLSRRAQLGIVIEDVDDGAIVTAVTPGGAGAAAGIQTNDVLVVVNGVDVVDDDRSPSEVVVATMGDVEPGAVVPVQLRRGDETLSFDVQTREDDRGVFTVPLTRDRQGRGFVYGGPNVQIFDHDGDNHLLWLGNMFGNRWRGMELVPISEGLGTYFGTDEGLLIVRAPSNESIGLRDGDVILEISGRTPSSPQHAMRILASFEPGETVELSIMRRQRRETVEYEVPSEGD